MNRRRFLSMLGAIPAVLALPAAATKPSTVKIVVRSPMNDARSDVRYATAYLQYATALSTIERLREGLIERSKP